MNQELKIEDNDTSQPISDLPVGALIKDIGTTYKEKPIIWRILEHNHSGDPIGTTTLETRDIITWKSFDARENNSSITDQRVHGNSRYLYSNLLQWLNSDKNNWYQSQHQSDTPPESFRVSHNPYVSEAGFLTNFSKKLKAALQNTEKITITYDDNTEHKEIVTSKVFLLSASEVNLGEQYLKKQEGNVYSYYSQIENYKKLKYFTNKLAALEDSTDISLTRSQRWWLRTPYVSWGTISKSTVYCVPDYLSSYDFEYGIKSQTAFSCSGVSPAICVPSTLLVSKYPEYEPNGIYILQ